MSKFGDEKNALAAYNAGEGNVMTWIKSGYDEIPFSETKEYLKRVNFARWVYSH